MKRTQIEERREKREDAEFSYGMEDVITLELKALSKSISTDCTRLPVKRVQFCF